MASSFRPNDYFRYFLIWIVERQNIFWKRHVGYKPPYTDNKIMRTYKFTNVYRVLDRATQYMLREVIYNGKNYKPEDMFWRILVYKHFNSPNTWDVLINRFKDITLETDLDEIISVIGRHHSRGYPIYSNAYMLTATFMKNEEVKARHGIAGTRAKHEAYLKLFKHYLLDTDKIRIILQSQTMEELFLHINSIPTTGGFLAYQYAQDLVYSPLFDFDLNSFCFAGGGTRRGIDRIFKGSVTDYEGAIMWTHRNLKRLLDEYGMDGMFTPIPNFWPQVPDISNCFCETDKYIRGMGIQQDATVKGSRIKNTYKRNPNSIVYTFPPKWGIDLLKL